MMTRRCLIALLQWWRASRRDGRTTMGRGELHVSTFRALASRTFAVVSTVHVILSRRMPSRVLRSVRMRSGYTGVTGQDHRTDAKTVLLPAIRPGNPGVGHRSPD